MKVYCDTKWKEVVLANAGENWYDINSSLEVIPEGTNKLEITRKNMMSKEILQDTYLLDGLPIRTDRTTRLAINFTCKDRNTGEIRVRDLGFGEFFPETGTEIFYTIEI